MFTRLQDWAHGCPVPVRIAIVALTILLAVGWTLSAVGAIPQPEAYHRYADQRSCLGIPNFGNVASNLAFVVAGLHGLWLIGGGEAVFATAAERTGSRVLAYGAIATGLGSIVYHVAPTNETLAIDRAGMILVLMPLLAIVLMERVDVRFGRRLLWPLVALGLASVAWWIGSEWRGRGDLRPYVLAQFLSILVVVLLHVFPSRYRGPPAILIALALYVIAKLFEKMDFETFVASAAIVSGHTMKHLVAAGAVWCLVYRLRLRTLRQHMAGVQPT
jgi:hypothetical protein